MSKKEKASGTELATSTQFSRDQIPGMVELINKKIQQLKKNRENQVRITEPLAPFGRITDIKDTVVLRQAYSMVTRKAEAFSAYDGVFKELNPSIELKAFKEVGHSLAQWQDEIKAQYLEVTFGDELDRLEKGKNILSKYLSEDQKFNQDIADFADLFKLGK